MNITRGIDVMIVVVTFNVESMLYRYLCYNTCALDNILAQSSHEYVTTSKYIHLDNILARCS